VVTVESGGIAPSKICLGSGFGPVALWQMWQVDFSHCGRLFSTSEEALVNTEQATRAFYLAFEGHNCDEDAGFQPATPS
jgi:hypothetical protein